MEDWLNPTARPWIGQAYWDRLTPAKRWRRIRGSTIRNELGLARTSYLNASPAEARKRCQRILLSVRQTRPALEASDMTNIAPYATETPPPDDPWFSALIVLIVAFLAIFLFIL